MQKLVGDTVNLCEELHLFAYVPPVVAKLHSKHRVLLINLYVKDAFKQLIMKHFVQLKPVLTT